MSEALFVDATIPFVRSTDGETVLLPSSHSGTWLYASTSARMARGPDGRYVLSLLRRRTGPGGGAPAPLTVGGVLAAHVHTIALVASPSDEAAWTELLEARGEKPPVGDTFTFLPLARRNGRMTLGGVEEFVDDPRPYRGVTIGTPTAAPVSLLLNAHGADAAMAALEHGAGPAVAVCFDYRYDLLAPLCRYTITADARLAHGVLIRHPVATAGYFGASGGQEPLDALILDLRNDGAVELTWLTEPADFSEAALAAMKTAVLQRWTRHALDQLIEAVGPDAEAAGGVAVTLKDPDAIGDIDLSERYDGQEVLGEPFSFSLNLAQLDGLSASAYAADISDEATVPIVLNFAPDSRVQRYVCQFGYQNPDGTVVSARREASGPTGLSATDKVKWEIGTQPPAQVEVRYAIEWTDPSWANADAALTARTDIPCIIVNVSPGTRLAEITLVSDLTSAENGSVSAVSWTAELPPAEERPAKTYVGSFFAEGAGGSGQLIRELATFPYPEGREKDSTFRWTAEAALPNGTVLTGGGAFTLADTPVATIWLRELRPTIRA